MINASIFPNTKVFGDIFYLAWYLNLLIQHCDIYCTLNKFHKIDSVCIPRIKILVLSRRTFDEYDIKKRNPGSLISFADVQQV